MLGRWVYHLEAPTCTAASTTTSWTCRDAKRMPEPAGVPGAVQSHLPTQSTTEQLPARHEVLPSLSAQPAFPVR